MNPLCWLIGAAALTAAPAFFAAAPEFLTVRWTTENGLPSNTVRSLCQTSDGYLWVGTKAGLARFDGLRFKVFAQELRLRDGASLSCEDLAEDGRGRLWLRVPDAVICIERGQVLRYSVSPMDIQTMLASRESGVWIGTRSDGLKHFDNGVWTREYRVADGLAGRSVGTMKHDRQGRLWIRSGNPPFPERWQRFDPRDGTFQSFEEVTGLAMAPTDLLPLDSGTLWAGEIHELVRIQNGETSHFPNPGLWGASGPGILAEGEANSLWLAPSLAEKLIRLEHGRFHPMDMEHGLADSDIRSLLFDREGNLWAGYGAGGLQRFRPRTVNSMFDRNETGRRQQIDSIAAGAGGAIWLGSWTGLIRCTQDGFRRFEMPIPERQDARPVFEDSCGQVWFGTDVHGLFRLEHETIMRVPAADHGRERWQVTSLFEDRQGRLWVGSNSGLLERRGETFIRYTRADGLQDESIVGITEGIDGTLWAGTRNGGLHAFQGGRFRALTTSDGLLSGHVWPLLAEADGTLWAGTPQGLNRIGPDGRAGQVTSGQGLPGNWIYCLVDDGAGSYWANSERGIFRMRKAALHAAAAGAGPLVLCVRYGEADGAATAEGSGDFQPNALRAQDGRIWFSTTRGATVIDPARLIEREAPPPVVIEEVLADSRLVFADGRLADGFSRPGGGGPVRLGSGGAHGLEIRYTANSFAAPEKVRFRYQLEGDDPAWKDADTRRTAFYTNLRPGSYCFRVEASTHEGIWSAQPAVFAFSIARSFKQTAWFPALGAAGFLALAGALAFWRLRWQRRVLLADQRAGLERERTRIARDLHDDLGTALTGLALELDVARKQMDGQAAASSRLQSAAAGARELAARMREVVWAVNPRCDTVSSLASFLEQQTAQFLRSDSIRGRLEFPDDIPALPIDSEARHQIALAVREALTNVVRHARATEVVVRLSVEKNSLEVRVQDNGTGWQGDGNESAGGSHGLDNMRERLERLGGSFSVNSGGGGTTVVFRVPLHPPPPRRSGSS